MRSIFHYVILVILILSTSPAYGSIDYELIEPLTSDEMAFPPGRYQVGIDIGHTCRVDMDSPEVEPVLLWKQETVASGVLVDSDGAIWLARGEKFKFKSYRIMRVLPDSSTDWSVELAPESVPLIKDHKYVSGMEFVYENTMVWPVISLDGAVICYVSRNEVYQAGTFGCEDFHSDRITINFLTCIDLNGNIRWRTEPVIWDSYYRYAWRVDQDRIAMSSSDTGFNTYSISEGEGLEKVSIPGWSGTCETGPYATNDGGWVIQGDIWDPDFLISFTPYIYRLKPDYTTAWAIEFPSVSFSLPFTIPGDGFILNGNRHGLSVLEIDDGSELWSWGDGTYHACGITPDGNYVVIGSSEEHAELVTLDTAGNRLWSYEIFWPYFGVDDVIIYNDGCLLVGDRNRITLLYPDSSVKWVIDGEDIGIEQDFRVGHWRLNPTSDGGIACTGLYLGEDVLSSWRLYYFGPDH